MAQPKEKFTIVYKEIETQVEWLCINGISVFRIPTKDKTQLRITSARDENGKKFWTSIPEGRQAEAEVLGLLIKAWYRSNHYRK